MNAFSEQNLFTCRRLTVVILHSLLNHTEYLFYSELSHVLCYNYTFSFKSFYFSCLSIALFFYSLRFVCTQNYSQRRLWHPTPVLLPGKSHGRRAWWAVVHGVAKSLTRLSDFTFTHSHTHTHTHTHTLRFLYSIMQFFLLAISILFSVAVVAIYIRIDKA